MDKKFHDKIINLFPSKDLIDCVKAENFIFGEEELLKFINDYSPDFNKKIDLFEEASTVFCDKKSKAHAKKLISYNKKAFDAFMENDADSVYEITIKCLPKDADEETLLTKTFDGAIEMIKSWLKCYKNLGTKDNELSRYTIDKKTTTLPRFPRDIYNDKVGTLGRCVLGYKFKILDLSMFSHHNEMHCKSYSCDDCKTPCLSALTPRFPHFLKKYDLVAFYGDNLYKPKEIYYGIFVTDMEKCDDDTYFIFLDNDYIKSRKVDFTDENSYYRVFDAHCHPSYAELFKPNISDVPKEVYDDYLYAVEGLKKFDDANN